MNELQKEQIKKLREAGYSYSQTAEKLGLSVNTVKTHCRRHELAGKREIKNNLPVNFCLQCGVRVIQPPKRKQKKFCSDKCRMLWWNSHQDSIKRKANYEIKCNHCGKIFISYVNRQRKYCCHECYIKDRFC